MGIIADAPNLLLKDDALDVCKALKAFGGTDVIVMDTFAQMTPGANENAGEDVGKALAHCKRISRAPARWCCWCTTAARTPARARGAGQASRRPPTLRWRSPGASRAACAEGVQAEGRRGRHLVGLRPGDRARGPGQRRRDHHELHRHRAGHAQRSATSPRPLGAKEAIVNQVIVEMAQSQTQGIEVAEVIKEAVARMPAPTDGKRDTRKQHAKRALDALTSGDAAPYWIDNETGCLCVL
jgi:hypothetical protein